MPRSRLLLAAVAAAALLLAGCASDAPDADGTTPTPSDDVSGTVAWADDVCTEVADLRAALRGVGDGLTIDLSSGREGLDQARDQVEQQVDAVGAAVADLRAQLDAAPDDRVSQEAQADIDAALDDIETNQQEALAQAQAAVNADSVPEAVTAAGAALVGVRAAAEAAGDLVRTATGSASDSGSEVREAFVQAPACQGLSG